MDASRRVLPQDPATARVRAQSGSRGPRVRIHRGAHEVGGSCIELEARGQRIVLDVGLPLLDQCGESALPDVRGLAGGGDPSLLGVVISHPHPDHFGLLPKVASSVPVYIGEAAARILREAAFFSPFGIDVVPAGFLHHRQSFEIGPFRITPYLNDHSAFDAYSMLIEAEGRRLFYTGDIRAHGRKAGIFDELLRDPPANLDVLLMEGTHVREDSDATERGPSEKDVERACVEMFISTQGMVLAMFSPQNIDRLVTMYRACLRSGRDLVMDLYTAEIARATGCRSIPQAGWEGVRVYLPKSQRARVLREQAFDRTDRVRAYRIYPDELAARRGELVMIFRTSLAQELEASGCFADAACVWSMWRGYLHAPSGQQLQSWLQRRGIPLVTHHSSGHAFVPDLRRLVTALAPKRVVPIHSFAGDGFHRFFPRVLVHADGTWWNL